jgi:hypothetical protein
MLYAPVKGRHITFLDRNGYRSPCARFKSPDDGAKPIGGETMKNRTRDPIREDRIHNEAIVDAGPEEQAMSWYYYLENKISFPFPVYAGDFAPFGDATVWHRTA